MTTSVSRRTFLSASLAALPPAFAGARFAQAAAAEKPKLPFTLGFSLYGLKTLPIEQAIRTCAEVGFTDVEPALLSGYDTEPTRLSPAKRIEVRSILDGLGVRVPCLMENIRPAVDDQTQAENFEKLARAAELGHAWKPAEAGSKVIIETVLGGKPAEWNKLHKPIAAGLAQWAEVARKHDIVIAIKAHVGGALHTPDDTVALVREINSPHLKAAYDFSHFQLQGFDLEKSLRTLLPETVFIHVKDGRGEPGKFEFLLPGQGSTDYVKYFRLLREGKYTGSVTVEVSGQIHQKAGYDGPAAVRQSYQALHAAYETAAS